MHRNLAAHFDAGLGITAAGGFASQWSDLSGNARHLLQATGANQPIHLPFAGTKYGYLPGGTLGSGTFTTPDSVANSITGDWQFIFRGTINGISGLVGKDDNGVNRSYAARSNGAAGTLAVFFGPGLALGATSTASTGIAANVLHWIKITIDVDNGAGGWIVRFYISQTATNEPSEVVWTQLGADVTGVGTTSITDSATELAVGRAIYGQNELNGTIYRAQLYNGIDGTLAVDFDPSRWSSGTTFTASTGEEWTINSTGSKPAQIVDRPSLLFDGAAHFMKCAAFTLNQPETVYLVAKQVSWVNGDNVFDGNTSASMLLQQRTTSPRLSQYAGSYAGTTTDLAVGTTGVLCAVFNGASSSLTLNSFSASTGNAGASNAGGFTLGDSGSPGTYANIQAYEAVIYNVAHDAATRANIIRALMNKWGIS